MIQATSLRAFYNISDLGQRQQEVYCCLQKYGVLTNYEISKHLGIDINCVTPRTNELVKKELVIAKDPYRAVEGRPLSIGWAINDNNPQAEMFTR